MPTMRHGNYLYKHLPARVPKPAQVSRKAVMPTTLELGSNHISSGCEANVSWDFWPGPLAAKAATIHIKQRRNITMAKTSTATKAQRPQSRHWRSWCSSLGQCDSMKYQCLTQAVMDPLISALVFVKSWAYNVMRCQNPWYINGTRRHQRSWPCGHLHLESWPPGSEKTWKVWKFDGSCSILGLDVCNILKPVIWYKISFFIAPLKRSAVQSQPHLSLHTIPGRHPWPHWYDWQATPTGNGKQKVLPRHVWHATSAAISAPVTRQKDAFVSIGSGACAGPKTKLLAESSHVRAPFL